jgi:kynurenine formamidase
MRRLVLVLTMVVGCGRAPTPTDLTDFRVVDLTHPFDSSTVYWPTSPGTFALRSLSRGVTPGGWFYSANAYASPEHGGTHLDAPFHFAETGQTVDAIPLERLVVPARVVDVTVQAAADPDYEVSPDDIIAFEARHGRIPKGSLVLVRTGWSARWPDRRRYLGDDTPGDATHLRFPSLGEAAARLLVEERGVAGLGVDVASTDAGRSTTFPVHRIAAAHNVVGLENLTALEALPATGAWVIALPMPIRGGSGAPLRAIALVPR